MGADPHAAGGDLAQQRIQLPPRLAVRQGIDPHKHAIAFQKLFAHVAGTLFGVDAGFGGDAFGRQRLEDVD